MKRLKLKLEDLLVESFSSSETLDGQGTVQGHSGAEEELPGEGEAGAAISFPTCITRECTCWRTCPFPVWGC